MIPLFSVAASILRQFRAVDDVVMGGRSSSTFDMQTYTFRGFVSFDNGGGFASVRSEPLVQMDLSACSKFVLSVRGDGKVYKLRIVDSSSSDNVVHSASFETSSSSSSAWQQIEIPFHMFEPTFRGNILDRSRYPCHWNDVRSIGLLIARQEGPFALQIAEILAV